MAWNILRTNTCGNRLLHGPGGSGSLTAWRGLSSQACRDLRYALAIDPAHRSRVNNPAQSVRVVALYRDLYRTLRNLWYPRGRQSRRLPRTDVLLPLAQLRLRAGFFRYQAVDDTRQVDVRCARAHADYLVPLMNIVNLNSRLPVLNQVPSSSSADDPLGSSTYVPRPWVMMQSPTSAKYHNDLQAFLGDLLLKSEGVLRQQVRSLVAKGDLSPKSSIFKELITGPRAHLVNKNPTSPDLTTPELINALINCEVPSLASLKEHKAYLSNQPDFISALPFHQRFFNQYRNKLDQLGLVKFPKRAQISTGTRLAVPPHITGRPLPATREPNIVRAYWDLVRTSVMRSRIVPVTSNSLIATFDLQGQDAGSQHTRVAEERRFWSRHLASVRAQVVVIEVIETNEAKSKSNNLMSNKATQDSTLQLTVRSL